MYRVRIKLIGAAMTKPEIYRLDRMPQEKERVNFDNRVYEVVEVIHISEDHGFDVGLLVQ